MPNPLIVAGISGLGSVLQAFKSDPQAEYMKWLREKKQGVYDYLMKNKPQGDVMNRGVMDSIMSNVSESMTPDRNQALYRMSRFGGVGSAEGNVMLNRSLAPALAGGRADLEMKNVDLTERRKQEWMGNILSSLG
jgi:hypothetical protein